jgi:adenylate cyclase
MGKDPGGAEVPVSLLYSDVRDSTMLAEKMPPREFRSLIDRFFRTVFAAVDSEDGVIDHIVGDGVMAMWTSSWGGDDHPLRAVAAGRRLVADLASDPALGDSVAAGVGVHTGVGWVGVVGGVGARDFTVLGDTPNTVARLGSAVGRGELALSEEIIEAAQVDTSALDHRVFELKGKSQPLDAWVEQPLMQSR